MVDISVIDSSAQILRGAENDYDSLLELIGESRFVLLGEASHGTQEFYRERALITQRLISEKGFSAVAIEGDWPDAYRVNRFVCNQSGDQTAEEALAGFERFPSWMWRNTEVLQFVNWLRQFNDTHSPLMPKVGFYGLDLYSLFTSIDEVLKYLDTVDPVAAKQARVRYGCFDHFERDSQMYGYALNLKGSVLSCENDVVAQLLELHQLAGQYLKHDGAEATDAFFYAQQNARLVKNAEQYYRNMFNNRISSWNMRDRHMTEMLENLDAHITQKLNSPAKIVVWAHNSHLGDARATEMGEQNELNVGQLMRQVYPDEVVLVGFTTHHGYVTAASEWGAPAESKQVRPALDGSYEHAFHQTALGRFILPIKNDDRLQEQLSKPQLERAIGVIYQPETERQSHYFYANLAQQFDVVIHIDETSALKPLEPSSSWTGGEAPETYPVGY
jgi:erythromycin esterase-like protein